MPAQTPNGYPYPLGTDAVSQGDDAIKALADTLDARMGNLAMAAGMLTGQVTSNVSVVVALTFPVGRFSAAPMVAGIGYNTSTSFVNFSSATKDGCSMTVKHYTGTTGTYTFPFSWIAIGPGN